MDFPDTQPGPDAGVGEWNAYVAAGDSLQERRARLDQCPTEYRARVRSHVQTVFAIRKQTRTS